jgi:hypothetical protein
MTQESKRPPKPSAFTAEKSAVGADAGASAADDLSKQIDVTLEKQAGEIVRCVRVFGDNYRCNWWVREGETTTTTAGPNAADHLLATRWRVQKSRFLKVTRSTDGLLIEDMTRRS